MYQQPVVFLGGGCGGGGRGGWLEMFFSLKEIPIPPGIRTFILQTLRIFNYCRFPLLHTVRTFLAILILFLLVHGTP